MDKLSKSPLILVLTQVRFSPVLSVAKHVEAIQDRLRKLGLPLFQKEKIQELTIDALASSPEVATKQRWIFTDIERKNSLILSDDFVAMETSNYDHFPVFFERFQTFLGVIGGSLELDAVERVGLRYVDLIRALEGRTARELIRPQLRGLELEEVNGKRFTQFASMSQTVTEHGRLMVRVFHSNDGFSIPPDLAGTKIDLDPLPPSSEAVSLVDIDHFASATYGFDIARVLESLKDLHEMTDMAFQRVVTEEALMLWK